MTKILIVRSIADIEPRTQRTVDSLLAIGFSVKAILLDRDCSQQRIEKHGKFTIMRVRIRWFKRSVGSVLVLPIWWTVLLIKLLREDYDCVQAIDLDTLPACFIAAKLRRKKIIYEIFDYAADVYPHAYGLEFLRPVLKAIDNFLIPRTDGLIIADEIRIEQIGDDIVKRCPQLVTIYNSPVDVYTTSQVVNKPFTLFYGGILERDRCLIELIKAIGSLPEARLVIGGYGNLEAEVKALSRKYKNIEFLGKLTHEEIIIRTHEAHLIPCLYLPEIPNNVFASPNKFFESLMLGKPSIALRKTLFSRRLEEYDCGLVIDDTMGISEQIASIVSTLLADTEGYSRMARNARSSYLKDFSDIGERKKLQNFYSDVMDVA